MGRPAIKHAVVRETLDGLEVVCPQCGEILAEGLRDERAVKLRAADVVAHECQYQGPIQ